MRKKMKTNKIFSVLVMILLVLLTLKVALGEDSPHKGEVFINEFMANGLVESGDECDEWVEIYYSGTGEVDLSGWQLKDSNDETELSGKLNASQRFVLLDHEALGFTLTNAGETLVLYDAEDKEVDTVTYGEQEENKSYGKSPDGEDNWVVFEAAEKTPGADNGNNAPVLVVGDQTVEENSTLSLELEDFGYDTDSEDLSLTLVEAEPAESGITITNNALTWTPDFDFVNHSDADLKREVEVIVRLSDGELSDEKDFKITVEDKNRVPAVNEIGVSGVLDFAEGMAGNYQVVASDGDGDELEYSLENAPAGLTINASGMLNWANPVRGEYKNIKAEISDGTEEAERIFNLTVRPALEIISVRVGGATLAEGEESKDYYFPEEIVVEINAKNNLNRAVTGITASLDATGDKLDISSETTVNLAGGATATFTLKKKVPYDITENNYATVLKVKGKDYLDKSWREDTFNVVLSIKQQPADVTLTSLSWKNNKNTTYCDQSLILVAEYTNAGINTEDDIKISVKDATEKVNVTTNVQAVLGANQKRTIEIPLTTEELGEGRYTLNVKLTYRDGYKEDTETIELTKQACFVAPAPVSLTEDASEAESLDLANASYTPSKGVEGLNENIVYALKEQSNEELVRCSLTAAGVLTCGNLAAEQSGSSVLNITLTAGATVNEGMVTAVVTPVNDAPVVLLGVIQFNEDEAKEVALAEAVRDVDNELTSLTFSENGEHITAEKIGGGKLKFTASKDWHGTEKFNLTVSDGAAATTKEVEATVAWNHNDDKASLAGKSPTEASKTIRENENLAMNITLSNPDEGRVAVKWFVNEIEKAQGEQYTFNGQNIVGAFKVKAVLKNLDTNEELGSAEWIINTVDKPVDLGSFGYTQAITDPAAVDSFTLEKTNYGKIAFGEAVDLSEIVSLEEVVKIQNGLAAIDSAKAAGLNEKATVTLYNTGIANPVVKKTSQFTTDKALVTEITNINTTVVNGAVTFTVEGFSTYAVVEKVLPELELGALEVVLEGERNTSVNTAFTIKNKGTLEGLTVQISSQADSEYQIGIEPSSQSLTALGEATIRVSGFIPADAEGLKTKIGEITFTYGENKTKVLPIYTKAPSYLEITSLKLNGKTTGKFKLGEENTLKVKLENTGEEDIEDIAVKVTVKEIEGDEDDWEEESKEFDLDAGDDEEREFTFKTDMDLEGEQYTVEIEIEVDGEVVSETSEIFEVDREKHRVVIEDIVLPGTVYCNRYPTVYVEVLNQGESDEDEVAIKVKNTELGIELEKADIELDKYSDEDNNYRASFPLDLSQAKKGTYELEVEVYLEDELEESKTASLVVEDCVSSYEQKEAVPTYSAEELASQIQQQLPPIQITPPAAAPTVKTSFRESDTYLMMLALIVGLVFIAVILELAVLMRRK